MNYTLTRDEFDSLMLGKYAMSGLDVERCKPEEKDEFTFNCCDGKDHYEDTWYYVRFNIV